MTDPIAAMDQFGAALKGMAEMWGNYYRDLIGQGFEPYQALSLVRDAQKTILTAAKEG